LAAARLRRDRCQFFIVKMAVFIPGLALDVRIGRDRRKRPK